MTFIIPIALIILIVYVAIKAIIKEVKEEKEEKQREQEEIEKKKIEEEWKNHFEAMKNKDKIVDIRDFYVVTEEGEES